MRYYFCDTSNYYTEYYYFVLPLAQYKGVDIFQNSRVSNVKIRGCQNSRVSNVLGCRISKFEGVILHEHVDWVADYPQAKYGRNRLNHFRETDKLRLKPVIIGSNRSAGSDIVNFADTQFL